MQSYFLCNFDFISINVTLYLATLFLNCDFVILLLVNATFRICDFILLSVTLYHSVVSLFLIIVIFFFCN